jgi:uncharacterized protein (TIGR02001 family)
MDQTIIDKGINKMITKQLKGQAVAAVLAAAGLAVAAPASAQEADVSFNLGVASDYVFRGFTQTDEKAAYQGGVDVTVGGLYVGAWASNVDFGDSTQAEVDGYFGYRTEASGFALDVGVIGYGYLNEPDNADYSYAEVKLAASRAVGPATIGGAVYYSPDFFGVDKKATYAEANWAYTPPIDKLTLSGALGYQWLDVNDDYATWHAGATYAVYGPFAIDVRYYDTEFSADAADERVVVAVKTIF